MNIKILFFGRVRELLKINNKTIEFSDNSTLNDLVNQINNEYPILSELSIIYTKNNEYMYSLDTALSDNDVIGFIPPISGG
jgi:molybdopterin converting factor small subunit